MHRPRSVLLNRKSTLFFVFTILHLFHLYHLIPTLDDDLWGDVEVLHEHLAVLPHLRDARSVHGALLVVDDSFEADQDLRGAHVALLVLVHSLPAAVLGDLQLARLGEAVGDAVVARHHLLPADQLTPARFRHLGMLQSQKTWKVSMYVDRVCTLNFFKKTN